MAKEECLKNNHTHNILKDDGSSELNWKIAEEKNIKHSLSLSHTERFRIMMQLMRMDNMLSKAKITHKRMP